MNIHDLLVLFFTVVVALLIGLIADELFIKSAKNKRPYLTKLGIFFFGNNKKKSSEFIDTHKAVMIKIIDLSVAGFFAWLAYLVSIYLIERTFAFYFPILIFSINSLYLIIRKKYDKIKWMEWLSIILIYLIVILFSYMIIKYRWFGYN